MVADPYVLRIVNLATILAISALGLQLIVGYTGQFSFGHAAFYGVGAYASALLVLKLRLPFVVALPFAAIAAAITGALVAPVLRLSGHYLAIATLAVGEIVFVLMIIWKGLTNGAYGIYGIPMPDVGPLEIDTDEKYFILASLTLALIISSHGGSCTPGSAARWSRCARTNLRRPPAASPAAPESRRVYLWIRSAGVAGASTLITSPTSIRNCSGSPRRCRWW